MATRWSEFGSAMDEMAGEAVGCVMIQSSLSTVGRVIDEGWLRESSNNDRE
jgi:hypothetical protein